METLLRYFREGKERIDRDTITALFPVPTPLPSNFWQRNFAIEQYHKAVRRIKRTVQTKARVEHGLCIMQSRGSMALLTGRSVDLHVSEVGRRFIKAAVSYLKRAESYHDLSESARRKNTELAGYMADMLGESAAPEKKAKSA